MKSWDAVIVGAGPAGSSLAIHLARAGLSVAVIDAASFPRQKVCGEYLSPDAWPAFESLGVEADVAAQAVSLDCMRIVLPHARSLDMTYAHEARRPLTLSRYALDDLLVRRARSLGVEIYERYRVRGVLTENGQVYGVDARHVSSSHSSFKLRTNLVVAADGRKSTVIRQTGGIRFHGRQGLVGFKRHFQLDSRADPRAIVMHSLKGGYVGACTVEDGSLNVCGVIPRWRVAAARGSVDAALAGWLPRDDDLGALVHAAHEAERGAAAPGHDTAAAGWLSMDDVRRQRATPSVHGVVYVGDAMATIEPLTGQGMTLAMLSAQLAAETIIAADGRLFDRAWQQRYAADWRVRFASQVRYAHALGWLLRHPAVIEWLVRLGGAARVSIDRIVERAYRTTCRRDGATRVGAPHHRAAEVGAPHMRR